MLSLLFLYFVGLIHKAMIPFLKKTHVYKLIKLEEYQISNLKGVTILKLIIVLPLVMIYLILLATLVYFSMKKLWSRVDTEK